IAAATDGRSSGAYFATNHVDGKPGGTDNSAFAASERGEYPTSHRFVAGRCSTLKSASSEKPLVSLSAANATVSQANYATQIHLGARTSDPRLHSERNRLVFGIIVLIVVNLAIGYALALYR